MEFNAHEALLSNSFQKDRLELVNKGSLGRRRKPSRYNVKSCVSPVKGTESYLNGKLKFESNLGASVRKAVSETHLPNIHIRKLNSKPEDTKKRKTEYGRSSVLIQTWERRSQYDCPMPQKNTKVNKLQNSLAFPSGDSEKENRCNSQDAVIDQFKARDTPEVGLRTVGQHIYNYQTINGKATLKTPPMKSDQPWSNGHTRVKAKTLQNGDITNGSSNEEPEWISLSKKLCAKFIQSHLETHSADSSNGLEQSGVSPSPKSSSPQPQTAKIENPKRNPVKVKPTETTVTEQPQWIYLSRKLCTKFIEEHIECQTSTNVALPELHQTRNQTLGEPEHRIVEKLGRPATDLSKKNKEQPEWITLSRKLRAKFIEGHRDDPDTISLDNQLNASDLEEYFETKTSEHNIEHTTQCPTPTSDVSNDDLNKNTPPGIQEKHQVETRNGKTTITFCYWSDIPPPDKEVSTTRNSVSETQVEQRHLVSPTNSPLCSTNDDDVNYELNFESFQVENDEDRKESSELEITSNEPIHPCMPQKKQNSTLNDTSYKLKSRSESDILTCEEDHFYDSIGELNSGSFSSEEYLCKKQQPIKKETVCNTKRDNFMSNGIAPHESEDTYSKVNLKNSFISLHEKHSRSDEFSRKKPENYYSDVNQNCYEEINFDRSKYQRVKETCDKGESDYAVVDCKSKRDKNRSMKELSPPREKPERNFKHENGHCIVPAYKQDHFKDYERRQLSKSQDSFVDASHREQEYFDFAESKHNSKSTSLIFDFTSSGEQVFNEKSKSRSLHSIVSECEQQKSSFTERNSCSPHERIHSEISTQEQHSRLDKTRMPDVSKSIPSYLKSNNTTPKVEYENIAASIKPSHIVSIKTNSSSLEFDSKLVSNGSANSKKTSPKYTIETGQCKPIPSPFEFESFEIPSVCTPEHKRILSEQNNISEVNLFSKTESTRNGSTESTRNGSTDSETPTSTLYDEICREARSPSSCPSDSETSSWTLNKNAPYSVNPTPVSETDFSDCSLSVKCDYTPSCSNQSTLESRNSSCGSSSFYIQLGENEKINLCNNTPPNKSMSGKFSKNFDRCDAINKLPTKHKSLEHLENTYSSPDSSNYYINMGRIDTDVDVKPKSLLEDTKSVEDNTDSNTSTAMPESLRHLFTLPLTPIYPPAARPTRLLTRTPEQPPSHYYSLTPCSTSSVKHQITPAKPKKAERTERTSSIKIKDIAHGIILTFRRFQNHSKSTNLSSNHGVDVSHLAKTCPSVPKDWFNANSKNKATQDFQREYLNHTECGKPQRIPTTKHSLSAGFFGSRSTSEGNLSLQSPPHLCTCKNSCSKGSKDKKIRNERVKSLNFGKIGEPKRTISPKKSPEMREKKSKGHQSGKSRSKNSESRSVSSVSRQIQEMADGTLCLVTTVSGDTAVPGVYSDSQDTASEISNHGAVKPNGESNC